MAVNETDKLKTITSGSDLTNARPIVFDKRWDFGTQNVRGFVELKVLENLQTQQCEFNFITAIGNMPPLQYDIDVSGDVYREIMLPSDCRLLVDVANWTSTRRQVSFDLLLEIKLPVALLQPIRVYHDSIRFAIPTTTMFEELTKTPLPSFAEFQRVMVGTTN